MTLALSKASGIDENQIIEEIKQVNTTHGTIEYTALIQEMPSFQKLSPAQSKALIKVAIKSRHQAMEGLNQPFAGVRHLLETFKNKHFRNLALSDAPKNLAYLRLKKAQLIDYFDYVIGLESPSDQHFDPEFRMENKPFVIPVLKAEKKKPFTDLEAILKETSDQIRQSYFLIGNSHHSDMGLAKRYGLLFYLAKWSDGTAEDQQLLQKYVPEERLKQDALTLEDKTLQPHDDYQCVEVKTPLEIKSDLIKRGFLT